MNQQSGGRIETVIAFVVLAAVIVLFVRFTSNQGEAPVPSRAERGSATAAEN